MIDAGKALSSIDKVLEVFATQRKSRPLTTVNFDGSDCATVEELAAANQKSELVAAAWVMEHKALVAPVLHDNACNFFKALNAGGDFSDSACVVLTFSENAKQQLAIRGGLPPSELHITLGYFGKTSDLGERARAELRIMCKRIASGVGPIKVNLNGITRFSGQEDALVVNADSPTIGHLHTSLMDGARARDIGNGSEHGFTPHMTLGYLNHDDPMPITRWAPVEIVVNGIELWWGESREWFELGVTKYLDPELDDDTEIAIFPNNPDVPMRKDVYRGNGGRGVVQRCNKIIERRKRK